jgi:hypothetical protein
MFPLRFRLRSLMILVLPAVGIGVWTYRTLPIPTAAIGAFTYRTLPKCPVHGTVMVEGSVPIRYGLVRFSDSGLQYMTARNSLFPNCDDAVLGGCVVGAAQTKPKNVCGTCNATRAAWRLAQIKTAPTSSALSAGSSPGGSATGKSN